MSMASTPNEKLRDALIREAFQQARGGIPMTILAIGAVVWIHWLDTQALVNAVWLVGAMLVIAFRGLIVMHVLKSPDRLSLAMREWLFNGPLIVNALIWASLPFFTFDAASEREKFGALCILAGMAGGAATVLAPVKWPARIYLFCVLMPATLLVRFELIGPVISFLGVCFFLVMIIGHASARRLLIEAIRRRTENEDLLIDVRRQRNEVEKLNIDLRAAEAALRERNAGLEREVAERSERNRLAYSIIQNTAEGVLVTGPDGFIVEVNPAFTTITGYSADEAIGQHFSLLHSERQEASHYDHLLERLAETGKWEGEMWSRRRDASIFLERRSIDAVRDVNAITTHYVSVFNDISENYEKDEQLRHMALHDPLTDLANRSLLHEHMRMAIARAERECCRVALLFLDLDQFKAINDTLGHDIGDLLLKEIAVRLQSCIRATDTLARLGGDEFVVLLGGVQQREDCVRLAAKLMRALETPVDLAGASLHVNTSIGIALFPDDGGNIEALMKNADMALYAAKEAGKNRYEFFQASMSESAARRRELESALREALANDELILHFQAEVDALTGEATGFEALVRWPRPGHGFVSPEQFIPIAEESGLIDALGRSVIEQSCRQIALWHQAGHGWQKVAVNVSARQLIHQNVAGLIRHTIAHYGIPAGSLEIEVTESVVIADPEKTLPLLGEIRSMGIRIAIDDFGTGHSSLAYLRHLPIDIMKIDRSFVHEAEHNPTSQAIIRTIVSLSRALNLLVVAEGVETKVQADMLLEVGCEQLQGYYFAHPMPASDVVEQWLAGKRR